MRNNMLYFQDVCLPSSVSKLAIYRVYHATPNTDGTVHPAIYTTLLHLEEAGAIHCGNEVMVRSFVGSVNRTALPLCALPIVCSAVIAGALEHLQLVTTAREHYKTVCQEYKGSIYAHVVDDQFYPPSPGACIPCNSIDIKVHYSFDYTQQVHYPSDHLQPVPIYFLISLSSLSILISPSLPLHAPLSAFACSCASACSFLSAFVCSLVCLHMLPFLPLHASLAASVCLIFCLSLLSAVLHTLLHH